MTTPRANFRPAARGGFSLMEMLVIMAIATMLITLAANGLRTTWRSQQIYTSATSLMQALSLARSNAMRFNCPTQLRIYRFQDGDITTAEPQYRAYQVVSVTPGASQDQFHIVTELQRLEGTTVMSKFSQYSSIVASDTPLPGDSMYSYVVVEFRPDGSTNLETNPSQPWTMTLLSDWGADKQGPLPKDARTLVIAPETGAVSLY
ncbi:MAG: Verru_Chthon cassette protein D [Verrucomicrobiaceae bacterium]|nr:Verru_Chthon cassette protein D [Verrucomicrobiaceae bacterium]